MGAESSSLKNCHLQEALEVSSEQEWQLHHGKTGDESPVSVFVYKKAVQNKDLIENAAKVSLASPVDINGLETIWSFMISALREVHTKC